MESQKSKVKSQKSKVKSQKSKVKSQKSKVESQKEEYTELGVPEEWIPVLQELGYTTVEKFGEVEKHTKLHQEMMGYRKKNKLEIGTLTPEEVREWLEKSRQ